MLARTATSGYAVLHRPRTPLVMPLTSVVGLVAACTLMHALIGGTGCCRALLHTSKLGALQAVV